LVTNFLDLNAEVEVDRWNVYRSMTAWLDAKTTIAWGKSGVTPPHFVVDLHSTYTYNVVMDLTERQQAVFDFLKDYRLRHRRSPSYEEIRQHFGFGSLNSVRKHLQQLERKGYIRTPWGNQKRAVQIVPEKMEEPPRAVKLPLLGTVAAGGPLEAAEIPENVEVPEGLLGRGEHFALRARGDSMVEDGIFEGDLLLVQKRDNAERGQTVVALIDGEATVKRFYRLGAQIELRPANPKYEPIMLEEAQVLIRGVVVALLRRYR
jgi:repressor LexA